jgi:hypothetical protein
MDLGSGSTYSENMSAASGGPGGSQNQGPSGFGDGDSGGGNDVYSGYVAASQPRGGLQGIKDYFTGGGYDYGYQRSFGKDLTGIGGLLLGAINPVLGLAFKGYQAFKPELNLLGNSPTISSYLNNRRNLYAPDTINYKSIYTPPGGINNIRTNPNIINPNTIPDLDDPFYSNMLYAEAPKARMPSSGYDPRQKEKDDALELYYQENPELRPPEQGSLFGNGITSIV